MGGTDVPGRCASPLLAVHGVRKSFGGATVLEGVNLTVRRGQRVSLIGSNGAGKTTLFNIITRLIRADEGQVIFDDRDLGRSAPHKLIALGLARTFQHTALFPTLSVLENIELPLQTRLRRAPEGKHVDAAQLVDMLDLGPFVATPVAQLPYAVQKRVEIARALAAQPKLLVLDEPAGGISRAETEQLEARLRHVQRDLGISLLLIEHNMKFVMNLSDYIYVLDHGVLIASGKPTDIAVNPLVIEAYLGKSA